MRATILRGGKTTAATALRALRLAPTVDCVYLQKKLLPSWYLPLLRRAARKIVFDFDDALYAPRSRATPDQRRLAQRLKTQLDRMLDTVDLAVAGNEVLADYARQRLPRVAVVPTTFLADGIDAKRHAPGDPTVIGWIGSEGTLVYLDEFVPVLESLARRFGSRVVFRVISNAPFSVPGLEGLIQNVRWSLEREVDLVTSLDIGVMPLLDDDWSRGKCAFKAIQMMTCGLPVVASPVGANNDVIQDGINGYLAPDEGTWERRLGELVESSSKREAIGAQARASVLSRYAADHWAAELRAVLIDLCSQPGPRRQLPPEESAVDWPSPANLRSPR
jgi:glycosyltransferase involved in cell wall biosynthesis